jgi:SAM-dependent methyltransferase
VTPDLEAAIATLRPGAEAAAAAWHALVTAEREQVERLPNRPRPEDFYGPMAGAFRADPRRTGEPLLDELLQLVRPGETWIDLGAGGGRYALPIALRAKAVYAVEPSEGMRSVLAESAADHGIANIDVFDERWPCDSRVPVADVCFICHVGYDIADIGPFLNAMEAHAGRRCVAVMFEPAPLSEWARLWRAVHGEERLQLPALGEFVSLLYARSRTPDVRILSLPPRTYETRERLHAASRAPLWVREGSPEDAKLADAVQDLASDTPHGVVVSPNPRRLGIATWSPDPPGH